MAAKIRCFFYAGATAAPMSAANGRYVTDSVQMMQQPYLARTTVDANTSAPVSTPQGLTADTRIKLVQIQVESGKTVHVEVNPQNRAVPADTNSPVISGNIVLEFGPDWSLSFLEAA